MSLLERLSQGFKTSSEAVSAELRSNSRARLGVIAIGVILLLAVGLRVADHAMSRRADIATLRVRERELVALSSQEQAQAWARADRELSAQLANARSRLWSDGPVGTAHASFYTAMDQLVQNSGFQGAQVRLGDVRRIGERGEITELRVAVYVPVTSGATPESVHNFLGALARGPRLVYVRSLRVRFQPSILLEGEFAAFVLSDTNAQAGGSTTSGGTR